jgi:RsiW-degrading membrane proteinase PrsW (M82 family)
VTGLALLATAAGLVVSTALLAVVVTLVWWLDRYDREPLLLVAGVFVWGGAVAPLLALTSFTAATAILDQPLGMLAGAALEELLKAVAVVLVVRYSAEFDSPTDGLVYGTAAGLGFATVENLLVVIAGAPALPASGLLVWVLERTFFSAGLHGLATGIVGGFLGMAYLSRGGLRKAGLAACGWIAATGLHFAWNLALSTASGSSAAWWPLLAAMPVLYGIYLLAFWLFLRWEHRILREELEHEAGLQLVPAWVVDVIPFYRRRIRSEWWPRRAERVVLSRLLTRLAFRRYQTSRLPEDEAALASLEVVQLRGRVRRMLEPMAPSLDEGNVNHL